ANGTPCAAIPPERREGEAPPTEPPPPRCRGGWVGVVRRPASAARLNRRRAIRAVVVVVGPLRDVRVRLGARGVTVAAGGARVVRGHTALTLRLARRSAPGRHRLSVTATDRCGRRLRATGSVRLRS
ncbi:MAG TPA: hypothetical protein VGW10_19435, partial [Solirubrobacteraceae bacterium]|nr:hypothetical protein [Solirubrobacteraceae bacterium]